MAKAYYINPDKDILESLLEFAANYTLENIFARYNPYETAQEFLETGHFDVQKMYAFEDVTWDSVFANLKTVQFAVSDDKEPVIRDDMAFYFDYADMIHDMDSDKLVSSFGKDSVEISGYICIEIWEKLKELLISTLGGNIDYDHILEELKVNLGPIITDAIRKYCDSELIDSDLARLLNATVDVFEGIEHDEAGYFKAIYASVIKGTEDLICNPQYLQLGDRMKSAVKYYTSGISITVGNKLAAKFESEAFDEINKVAPGLMEFIPSLISMVVSCAIIITIDKNPLMIQLTDEFNEIPTITGNIALYRESAESFERMAAQLAKIDFEELKESIDAFSNLVKEMNQIQDPKKLNQHLLDYYKTNNKTLPWGNKSLEEHWANPNSRLVFK